MMYMPDCLRGTVQLLEAPSELLSMRTYNLAAISFTPEQIGNEIKRQLGKGSKFDVALCISILSFA
jgi:threonine 3-dehydrogenase